MQTECVILAGGRNSRYGGKNKAFVEVEARRIIDRNLEVLSPVFPHIRIISNSPELFQQYPYEVHEDIIKGIGPVGGIHTALKTSAYDACFIVSCDMPFLDETIIRKLLEQNVRSACRAIVPDVSGKLEPMHAIYHKSILPDMEVYIAMDTKRSVYAFLEKIETCYVAFDGQDKPVQRAFININRPSDLEQLF